MTEYSLEPDHELLKDRHRDHGKVTALLTVSTRVYDDGCARAHISHLDPGTRRLIPGPSWLMPEVSVGRATLLWWCELLARDTRDLEADSPPLPW